MNCKRMKKTPEWFNKKWQDVNQWPGKMFSYFDRSEQERRDREMKRIKELVDNINKKVMKKNILEIN